MDGGYERDAGKRTVSVALDGELCAKAEAEGIDVPRTAEAALAAELNRKVRAKVRAEIAREMDAYNAFIAEHGSFADMARDHFRTWNAGDAI